MPSMIMCLKLPLTRFKEIQMSLIRANPHMVLGEGIWMLLEHPKVHSHILRWETSGLLETPRARWSQGPGHQRSPGTLQHGNTTHGAQEGTLFLPYTPFPSSVPGIRHKHESGRWEDGRCKEIKCDGKATESVTAISQSHHLHKGLI